jgi:hypothetical protein
MRIPFMYVLIQSAREAIHQSSIHPYILQLQNCYRQRALLLVCYYPHLIVRALSAFLRFVHFVVWIQGQYSTVSLELAIDQVGLDTRSISYHLS